MAIMLSSMCPSFFTMNDSVRSSVKGALTVVGAFFLMLSLAMPCYYGNMSVYIWSYLVIRVGVISHINTPWVVSAFLIGWSFGLIVAGRMKQLLGRRLTLFCGIIIFDGGFFASYLTVQKALFPLIITLGFELGVGCGVVNGMAVDFVLDWAGENVGLVTGVSQSALCAGGAILNYIVTNLTNPNNRIVDVRYGSAMFLSQKEVLDRVPTMLINVGVLSLITHVLGFLMLQSNRSKENIKHDEVTIYDSMTDIECGNGNVEQAVSDESTQGQSNATTLNMNAGSCNTPNTDSTQRQGIKARDVIRTKVFLCLWYTFLCGDFTYLVINTYYKTFGQMWIKDDHFLTEFGTLILLTGMILRIFFGYLTDRIELKNCFLIIFAFTSPVAVFYYVTPPIGKVVFLVTTVLYSSVNGLIYSTYSVAAIKIYGSEHFSFIYGLLMSSTIVLNLMAPFVVEAILAHAGWLALYVSMAGVNFTAFIAILMIL